MADEFDDDAADDAEEILDETMDEQVYQSGVLNDSEVYDAKFEVFDIADKPVATAKKILNDWLNEAGRDGDMVPKSIAGIAGAGGKLIVLYREYVGGEADDEE